MNFASECQHGNVPGVALQMLPDQHYRDLMPAEASAIKRLANTIKTTRRSLGWTQEELAEKSGVSLATIKRYENAKTQLPESDPVRRIFRALRLDPREIPVILGLVTREEMGLPDKPTRRLSASTEQLIELLEDPDVSDDEKHALADLLRARQRARGDASPAPRKAG